MATARRRLQKIPRMHLSMFGRATAAGAYALHTATYHMEHSGLPPDAVLAGVLAQTAKVVDRCLGPADSQRRLTGVPLRLLPGHPTTGGFGVLPLRQHVRSRHAKWSLAFARCAGHDSPSCAPWQRLLAAYLATLHPSFRPMAVLTARTSGPWLGGRPSLPPDVLRLATALSHLPPVSDVVEPPLAPGDWCFNAPLWGNPLLPNAGVGGRRPGLEALHGPLSDCRRLLTIGDAVRVDAALSAFEEERRQALAAEAGFGIFAVLTARWGSLLQRELAPTGVAHGALQDRTYARAAVSSLLADISPAWLAAARLTLARLAMPGPPPDPPPSPDEVAALLLPRLGWRLAGDSVMRLATFTVRAGTQLQLADLAQQQGACHAAYVREALGLPPGAVAPAADLAALRSAFPRIWRQVKWEPKHKEVFWRLAVDGVPMPGNSHLPGVPREGCACGAAESEASPRLHHFWACPIAAGLLALVEDRCQCPVQRSHLWLGVSPDGGRVVGCVWDVVALAVLNSLEWARRSVRARRPFPPAGPGSAAAVLAALQATVLVKFWSLLRDFADLGLPRKGWDGVSAGHPFLRVVAGRLVCAA
jgi:hypothetical protein